MKRRPTAKPVYQGPRPQVGEKWVWEIPELFGPIEMEVLRVILKSDRPRVIFLCNDPARPLSRPYQRAQALPLPATMKKKESKMEKVQVCYSLITDVIVTVELEEGETYEDAIMRGYDLVPQLSAEASGMYSNDEWSREESDAVEPEEVLDENGDTLWASNQSWGRVKTN